MLLRTKVRNMAVVQVVVVVVELTVAMVLMVRCV
jgi:hypothetical protein